MKTMRKLGVIGGMSWESTAIYYRLINEKIRARLGGLHSAELLLWSFDFAKVATFQAQGDWHRAEEEMVRAGRALRAGGAQALLIATNTMHKRADAVEAQSGLPVLHIADATARVIRHTSCKKVGLLATRFTMEEGFYKDRLRERHGIETIVPDAGDRQVLHGIIYDELCQGRITQTGKERTVQMIDRLIAEGAEGIILGCTEICLLIGQEDVAVPVFDTTALHAAAAVEWMLEEEGERVRFPLAAVS